MKFVGGYTNFGAQPVLKSVSEARRGVDHNGAGVHCPEEMHRSLMAIRDNAVGVTGSVLANMSHRLLNAVDNFDRQNRRQLFFIPITSGSSGTVVAKNLCRLGTSA